MACYGIAWIYSAYTAVGNAEWPKGQAVFWTAAFAAAVFLGCMASVKQQEGRQAYAPVAEDGKKCLIQGKIIQKESKEDSFLYDLKDCQMQLDSDNYVCKRILVSHKTEYSIGEILCMKAKIKTFALPANEGNYNEREYYRSLNIDFLAEGEEVLSVHGKKSWIRETLYECKERMKESYQKAMPDADAGVLTAMTLGDKSLMDKERRKLYQNAGISHFYSISGLHISMLGMALYHFLRKRGASYFVSGSIAAILIFGYGELIGFGISAGRAIGMFFVFLYAKYRGQSYDRATALTLLAAVLAGNNPGLLRNAGYLLSFGAVAGVLSSGMFLDGKEREPSEKKKDRYLGGLREAAAVSISIQLITIPVMCQFFYEIPVYAVLANFIVLPCMGALLGFGILGGAIGCFFPFAGKVLLFPCYLILLLFEAACRFFLNLPGSSLITGQLPLWKILFWYGAILLFWAVRNYKGKLPPIFLLLLCLVLMVQKKPDFEVSILDVGQGDGICILTGDGTSIFIDGGSSNVSKAGTYRILPFLKCRGIRRIDYWFVSHCDADHVSGLSEVIESGYPIKYLVAAKYAPKDEEWLALQKSAKEKKIPILRMKPLDVIRSRKNLWNIQCLSPGKSLNQADRNENSLAILYQSDICTGFFAGDIGEETEKKILEHASESGKLLKADLYKASHHGSDNSNCKALLEALSPKIAVISCGLKNSYGHPGKGTMKRLSETNARIYETRYLGQIKITGVHLETEVTSVLECTDENNR